MNLTECLADFASSCSWDEVPEAARRAARRETANAIALAIGSADDPAVRIAVRTAAEVGESGPARLLGRPERLHPAWAAFVHGIGTHVADFDDTHPATIVHPGSPVVPAALAAAEVAPCSGQDLAQAVLVGTEVALRLGLCLVPGALGKGWHMTGLAGHVGAAVAAGRVLGLTAEPMAQAMCLAASQAAGMTAALGTMAKSLHAGKAAANGVRSAMLAENGWPLPPPGFDGLRGLVEQVHAEADLGQAVALLGKSWEVERNEIKPYACGVLSHAVMDIAKRVRAQLDDGETVEAAELTVSQLVVGAMGNPDPRDALQTKFSVYHCFAVGVLRGAGGVAEFSDACAVDPGVRELRRRVRVDVSADLGRYEVRARVTTTGATVFEHRVLGPDLLTDAGLYDKITRLVEDQFGPRSQELARVLAGVDALPSVEDLWRATTAVPRQ